MLPNTLKNIKAYRGDDLIFLLSFKKKGVEADVSDWTNWRADLYGNKERYSMVVDASRSTEGLIQLSLPHKITENIRPGGYTFDLEATRNDIVRTFARGPIAFYDDVTKPRS